jgi:predicted P-loop ATPase/GTPase
MTGYPVNPRTLLAMFTDDRCKDIFPNKPVAGKNFNVAYGDYSRFERFEIPTAFDIRASDGKNSIRIKANFEQILFEAPEQINMNVPSNYKIIILQ